MSNNMPDNVVEKVIVDCDNTMGLPFKEIDDGLTLIYLLGRSDIEVLGVTTTFGNGTIDEAYPQTEQLLRDVNHLEIPVYRGEGQRGQSPTEAARFLAETVSSHPGEVTLLATGPLGNLRTAAELDPDFFGNIKQIACMGGYVRPLRIGWRDVSELNLSKDPEAAFAVLNAPCLVTLMNAQICLQAAFGLLDLLRIRHWGRNTRRIVRNWLLTCCIYWGIPVFYLWDLLPAVYISHPELFDTNLVQVHSTVADLETGTLIYSEGRDRESQPLINMPTHILDSRRFRAILFESWRKVPID
jgi:purine nucleosidase